MNKAATGKTKNNQMKTYQVQSIRKAARKMMRSGVRPSVNSSGVRYLWVPGEIQHGARSASGRVCTSQLYILPVA